jgi:hypothetical protein
MGQPAKHEPAAKKNENSEKMNAYIRASTDNRGDNTYEVDLFYDVFAKHVVMRFVLLNTKGTLFWCHKPWKVAPAISNYLPHFGFDDLNCNEDMKETIRNALHNVHALSIRDINKGKEEVLKATGGWKEYCLLTIFNKGSTMEGKKDIETKALHIMDAIKQICGKDAFKKNLSENLEEKQWNKMRG